MNSIQEESEGDESDGFETLNRLFRDPEDEVRFGQAIRATLPIELEIGSGKGLFLTNAAKAEPNHFFIGLELAAKYAREAQAKLDRLKIHNAVFIASDATKVIASEVPDRSVVAVHVYFPDPWWKAKHKKRRVLSDETILHIQRVLKPNGQFHFWTDVLDYYEIAVPRIVELTTLDGPFYVPEPTASHGMDYRTHFERRTRLNGLPVYRARFTRTA
ncbi:MAG: tRNA (guanine(46)-N(7))-methyltransferase TrmB [Pirellula sp.]|jgi:tRNA (guanine-N7-)-methyltransferase